MGLTIHYSLHARIRSTKRASELMGQLRSKALDLPFKEVGEVVELAGKMKDLLGGDVEASIMKFQNFEHLEAEGRKDELLGDAGEGV